MFEIRRALYWQLFGVLIAVVLISVSARFFPIVDLVENLQQRVIGWGAWGAVCYPLLFAACNILLLPGGVLAVGGGFFFGLWWGFFILFLGNVVGAAISFALSRWIAGGWFRRKLSQNATLRALEPAMERESWKIILLTQLHPLFPTSLLNYLYGMTRIRFGTYMLWASIGRMPGLFLYVYIGTLGQLGLRLMRGRTHPRLIEYWTWGGAFVTTALLLFVLARIASRTVQTAQANETAARAKGIVQPINVQPTVAP
ncbi:MAG: VTT domain-containing protein [Verrucomicrobiota bacterium]